MGVTRKTRLRGLIGRPPFNIHEHGRKLLRRAVVLDDELCDAIMGIAMGSQGVWSLQEIRTLNDYLDACELTVAEWLKKQEM